MTDLHNRAERAEEMARSRDAVEQVTPGVFAVKSQSGSGVYLVSHEGDRWKCICPDFVGHALPCKHILAVRLVQGGVTPSIARKEDAKRPRKTYGQNWPAYNRAQRAELELLDTVLAELVSEVEDPTPQAVTGRPRLPFADLLFCAVQKVYQGIPLRVAHGLNDRLQKEGKIAASPSCNMVSNLLRRPEVTPILNELIAKSALALASVETTFAVDSSGFRTTSFGNYCREKYGAPSHNLWVKASIIIGTKTHIIPCVVLTDGHVSDSPQLPALVSGTVSAGFVMKEVYADKGYLAETNFDAIGSVGALPFIRYKQNSHGHRRGGGPRTRVRSALWKKMWHLFQSDPAFFLDHYHMRENVEAVFAAIKKKLGETLKSKDPVAQRNELLCKILAYNITVLIHEAFERGIEIPGARRDSTPAQAGGAAAPPESAVGGLAPDSFWPEQSWENN